MISGSRRLSREGHSVGAGSRHLAVDGRLPSDAGDVPPGTDDFPPDAGGGACGRGCCFDGCACDGRSSVFDGRGRIRFVFATLVSLSLE